MRLLHCDSEHGGCDDVFRLHADDKTCRCGKSTGCLNSDEIAQLTGPCRVLRLEDHEVWLHDAGAWKVNRRVQRADGWFCPPREKPQDTVRPPPRETAGETLARWFGKGDE